MKQIQITASDGTIKVISKNNRKVSVKEVELMPLWAFCMQHNRPYIDTFLSVFEKVIKETVSEVFPHKKLDIIYRIESNDSLENSNEIEIILENLRADNEEFEIIGEVLRLEGNDKRDVLTKLTSFHRRVNATVEKTI
ncbi:conserved hypothetical protein [Methanothermus fervidus DSM 2088]|uniref:Uncharacterized protein n=1 Tax=Methanothermus fervidus (strain ATCC 43054 / DSM 2088 / JCM 10308 / V24 S) TaxID=523846 RepID=E3GY98_METFV|nr:hypothetical protein [Methanothermus fervidus]ADP77280.1 conserved hypothetical protein [Methanothermus fervidus DSM 2088]